MIIQATQRGKLKGAIDLLSRCMRFDEGRLVGKHDQAIEILPGKGSRNR